jgi:hypothetical protein
MSGWTRFCRPPTTLMIMPFALRKAALLGTHLHTSAPQPSTLCHILSDPKGPASRLCPRSLLGWSMTISGRASCTGKSRRKGLSSPVPPHGTRTRQSRRCKCYTVLPSGANMSYFNGLQLTTIYIVLLQARRHLERDGSLGELTSASASKPQRPETSPPCCSKRICKVSIAHN